MTDQERLIQSLRDEIVVLRRAKEDAMLAVTPDATILREAGERLRRNWPGTAGLPPLADIIAHLGYRANVLENTAFPDKRQ